jgi:hypothetical protein
MMAVQLGTRLTWVATASVARETIANVIPETGMAEIAQGVRGIVTGMVRTAPEVVTGDRETPEAVRAEEDLRTIVTADLANL